MNFPVALAGFADYPNDRGLENFVSCVGLAFIVLGCLFFFAGLEMMKARGVRSPLKTLAAVTTWLMGIGGILGGVGLFGMGLRGQGSDLTGFVLIGALPLLAFFVKRSLSRQRR